MAKIHNEEHKFPEYGNFVSKGTTLLAAEPFAYVLSPKFRSERCDTCFQRRKISRCSGCRYVYYCSKNCQKKSWIFHKVECPNIKKCPMDLPEALRMMARVIIKLQDGGDKERGYYSPSEYRTFDDLMSHYYNIKTDLKRIEHFMSLYGALRQFLPDSMLPSIHESLEIFGRMNINSFHILENGTSVGVGLYLGPSIIDHSCRANASITFDSTKIVVRTLCDIPSFDWTKVSISYIEVLKSVEERREELKDLYYFRCECDWCNNPDPVSEAAACPNKKCTNPCFPEDSECSKCGELFGPDFQDDFELVESRTRRQLEKMEKMKGREKVELSRKLLKEQEGLLHPLNALHVRTLEAASAFVNDIPISDESVICATKLTEKYEYYFGDAHPMTAEAYLELATLLDLDEKPERACDVARKALDVVKMAYGENSTRMREAIITTCLLRVKCEDNHR